MLRFRGRNSSNKFYPPVAGVQVAPLTVTSSPANSEPLHPLGRQWRFWCCGVVSVALDTRQRAKQREHQACLRVSATGTERSEEANTRSRSRVGFAAETE